MARDMDSGIVAVNKPTWGSIEEEIEDLLLDLLALELGPHSLPPKSHSAALSYAVQRINSRYLHWSEKKNQQPQQRIESVPYKEEVA